MVHALHPESSVTPSTRWAIYAGLYLFLCGLATVYLLSDILGLLADVINLPTRYTLVILASPILGIGTGVWWLIVERRDSYSYLYGGLVGLLTALLTGLLWTARFIAIWGMEMITLPMVALIVLYVLGFVVIAGTLTGLPLMYARRKLTPRRPASEQTDDAL